MTEPTGNDEAKTGEFIPAPATITTEQANGSRDNAYIFNYANNPKAGKTAALRATGWTGNHERQEAHRIHNRLRLKIQAVTAEQARDLGSLSYQQLHNILMMNVTDTGLSAMLKAIQLGKEWSQTQPPPTDDIPNKPAVNEMTKRIERLKEQISHAEGTPVTA